MPRAWPTLPRRCGRPRDRCPLPRRKLLSAAFDAATPVAQRLPAERRRLQTAPQPIRADIQAHIAWLEPRLARTDADLAAGIRSSPL